MIKFKRLAIKNFLSYGEAITTINLDTVGTTLIVGEDLDNTASGTGANGVGKTVWINALIYALFGKPISNISLDNLVNNINKKNMMVEVEFEKDGKLITVRRARKETGVGGYAKVFIRDADTDLDEKLHDKTPDSIGNINSFIVELLGIPYELFVRIVAFAATHTPFLDLPVRHASQANQSDIMEELFRLTRLSVKAEALKASIKDVKQTLEIKIKHNEQLEKEHERHNKQIDTATSRVDNWDDGRKDDISAVKKKLTEQEAIPVKEQEDFYKQVDKLKAALIKERDKQKDLETLITEISAGFTVSKTHLATAEKERENILTWKDGNTKKIVEYKKIADELPDVDALEAQLNSHDELEVLRKKLSEFAIKEDELDAKIKVANADIAATEKHLVHLEDANCPYCLQQFADAANKIVDCNAIIKSKEQEHVDCSVLVDMVQKNVAITETDISTIQDNIKYTIDEITDYTRSRLEYTKKLEELFNEKCPYGDGTTINEIDDLISTLKDEATKVKGELSKEAGKLVEIDEVVDTLTNELEECENSITIKSLDELYEIKNNIKQYKTKIKELTTEINPYIEPLKELQDIKLEPIDMDSVNELNNLITHQNYLVKLLTKKDSFIRKMLLNKNLAFLNQRLQHYLSALGLPHKVEFTHEMTANITQFGRELDFGNLSSGQKARVNLGLSFSFRDVLQQSHDSINVCMLDEVLDVGLDSVGVQNAARMLKHKAREEDLALYIISHRDEVSNIFDNRMVVQMEKGFSSVKIEE